MTRKKDKANKEFHLRNRTEELIGWIATLLGWLFLVLNLIVYSYAVPVYTSFGNLAGKAGTDFDGFTEANYKLETVVNEVLQAGFQSAYIAETEEAQSYLDGLNVQSYRSIEEAKNKINSLVSTYGEYKERSVLYEEKYSVKIAAEKALALARESYADKLTNYEELSEAFNKALTGFAEGEGAYTAIPDYIYADLQKASDDAWKAISGSYTKEEWDEKREAYETALSAYNAAKEQLASAEQVKAEEDKHIAEDSRVIAAETALSAAEADLNDAQKALDGEIDKGTYDIEEYVTALNTAQAAYDAAKEVLNNAIKTVKDENTASVKNAQKALSEAETALNEAKLTDKEIEFYTAENNLNDAENTYRSLLEAVNSGDDGAKLEIAKIVYAKADNTSKSQLTKQEGELNAAKNEVMPLFKAEEDSVAADEAFGKAQAALPENQSKLLNILDEIVSFDGSAVVSSDVFAKIISDYNTTLDAYIDLTENGDIKDPEIVIDRFVEKNLAAFDGVIDSLVNFVSYGYSLDLFESEIENYAYLSYDTEHATADTLYSAINTALTEFNEKYAAYTMAQSAYGRAYSDYAFEYKDLTGRLTEAQNAYDEEQNAANEAALKEAKSYLELAVKSYDISLCRAVTETILTKAEANAYLSRLNTYIALYKNIAVEIEPILNDLYVYNCGLTGGDNGTGVDGKIHLDYLPIDEGTVNAVLGNYNLTSYVEKIEKFFADDENCYNFIENAGFDDCVECEDITDAYLSDMDKAVKMVNSVFEDFNDVTKNLSSDSASMFAQVKQYNTWSDILSLTMMIFDIILAVIMFAYFMFWIYEHRSEVKQRKSNK